MLLRNGPNPQFEPDANHHWFTGDGMIHAITFKNSKASYRNRWVRTKRFLLEQEAGCALFGANKILSGYEERVDRTPSSSANTNIVDCNGVVLALNERGLPYEVGLSELKTMGEYDFNSQINKPLTAHPRYFHPRKEHLTYSYANEERQLIYYRVSNKNQVMKQAEINWPYPAMIHDFVNTENYVVFPIFPCSLNIDEELKRCRCATIHLCISLSPNALPKELVLRCRAKLIDTNDS